MEGNPEGDGDRDRRMLGVDNSAAEGDGDGARYRSYSMVRCSSQSSLDESSQRPDSGEAAAGALHAAKLLNALSLMRHDATLCDVQLLAQAGSEADGRSVSVGAHRAVLAACSPYFRAMFTQFDERTQPTVTIQNVEPEALEAIVEYIYDPDSLVITEDNVQGVLAGASLLAVGGARARCCRWLGGALSCDNALGVRAFAELHACSRLAERAQAFVLEHFASVMQAEEFLQLSAEALAPLLQSDRIVVADEELVLDAVLRWMAHDAEARRPLLGALLEHVRLPLVKQQALVARAAAEPLLSAPLHVKDLLIEALSWHLSGGVPPPRAPAACARTRPRRPPAEPKMVLVVGGQAPKAVRCVEAYCLQRARWLRAAPLPSRRCRAGVALHQGDLYAVGGFNGTLRVRSVDVYNVASDCWRAGPALLARRSTLGVALLGGVLYAVGGFDGAAGLNSAEALDVGAGATAWRAVGAMSVRRSSVGVCALGGRVWAVGGYDGARRQCLNSTEWLAPPLDAWQAGPDMLARRSGAAVAALADPAALYAIGGHDGPAVRRSVERLLGGPGARWEGVAAMVHARRNAAAAAHGGRLLVVGGDDGAANLGSVEVYDPSADAWTVLSAPMAVGRSYAGVCVVPRAALCERDDCDERDERDEHDADLRRPELPRAHCHPAPLEADGA